MPKFRKYYLLKVLLGLALFFAVVYDVNKGFFWPLNHIWWSSSVLRRGHA